MPFDPIADLQEDLRGRIRAGTGPETLLLLEHAPVITVGKSGQASNVLLSVDELAARGITVSRASRGGDVTYHGPGQLVGYPVMRLRSGVRAHVEGMATALIDILATLGIEARYKKEAPGLWVDGENGEAKLCAFGINVHHRITVHGFALNLAPDLDHFRLIVPCGLKGARVTSVEAVRGESPTPEALAPAVAAALGSHLGVTFTLASEQTI